MVPPAARINLFGFLIFPILDSLFEILAGADKFAFEVVMGSERISKMVHVLRVSAGVGGGGGFCPGFRGPMN